MSLNKCNAIVLNTIKYSENSIILKCYTDLFGLQSYMINGFKGKNAVIKPSQIQALTLLEIEAYHAQNKGLQRIKEAKCYPTLYHLHYHIIKSSLALFISEVVTKSVREENHPDVSLFQFLTNAIQIIDLETGNLSNFSCYFLIQLTKYLGFSPLLKHTDDYIIHPNNPQFESLEKYLIKMNEATFSSYANIQIPYKDREILLEAILKFYTEHISDFGKLKSYPVLKTLFV